MLRNETQILLQNTKKDIK